MQKPLTPRIVSCALIVGVLFSIFIGVSASSAGVVLNSETGANQRVTPTVQTEFSPILALIGFCLGVPIGVMLGFLWGRSGLVGALGIILISLLGGFVGLMGAGLFGAETRVAMSDTAISVEHGPSNSVLIVGAALGTFLGALCAWWLRPVKVDTDLHKLPA